RPQRRVTKNHQRRSQACKSTTPEPWDSNACCAGKDCGNAYLESKGDMTRGWGLRDEYFRAFLDSEHKRLRKKE
ncbi:hypothetical protein, partial [Mycobacterium marinum]